MRQSETIGSLVAALAKAQQEIKNPPLDSVNPHFKNRYASLGAHLDAIREPFARHGLIMTQGVETESGQVSVTTVIAHSSGEWMSSSVGMPLPERATAQNLGALVSYLRRYAIGAAALLTGDEDNDAESDRLARQERTKPSAALVAPPPAAPPAAPKEPSKAAKPVKSDVFSTVAVAKADGVQKPAQTRRWPDSGIDIVVPSKVVDRTEFQSAVLCTHATLGAQWVSVSNELISAVKLEKRMELTWQWNKQGFYEALEIRPAPKLSDMLAAEGSNA